MKAAVFEGPEQVVLKEVPIPEVKSENLLIKIQYCAICGSDIRIYYQGHKLITPPRIIGHEIAGIVVKAGKEVHNFKEGDRITIQSSIPCLNCSMCKKGHYNICDNLKGVGFNYDGGFAEYMLVSQVVLKTNNLLLIPDNLSFEEASVSEPFACVINGQELSQIKEGDSVAIIGAGPIGCMHICLAKFRGASKIILLEKSKERLELARNFPADYYIDTSEQSPIEEVMKITENQGVDVVIAAAPSSKAQEDAFKIVSKRGRVNLFGGLPKTDVNVSFDSNWIHYREIFVHGSYGSTASQQKEALSIFSTGKIDAKKFISFILPLEKINEAFEIAKEAKVHKILIKMGENNEDSSSL